MDDDVVGNAVVDVATSSTAAKLPIGLFVRAAVADVVVAPGGAAT